MASTTMPIGIAAKDYNKFNAALATMSNSVVNNIDTILTHNVQDGTSIYGLLCMWGPAPAGQPTNQRPNGYNDVLI